MERFSERSTGASRRTSGDAGADMADDLVMRAARIVAQEWRPTRTQVSPWMADEIRRSWPVLAVSLDFLTDALAAEATPRAE